MDFLLYKTMLLLHFRQICVLKELFANAPVGYSWPDYFSAADCIHNSKIIKVDLSGHSVCTAGY